MSDLEKEYGEFIRRVEYGEYVMAELERFIFLNLLTEEQARWMKWKGLTLMDLIVGGWPGFYEEEISLIFNDWNNKCGTRLFRIA